jgi:hypothetical protein
VARDGGFVGVYSRVKTTQNTTTGGCDGRVVIATGFERGFSLLMPGGEVLYLPPCTWHDDESYCVVESGQGFVLISEDSRDNGFAELKREALPEGTMAAYNPEEGDRWQSLHNLGAAAACRESNA